MEHIGTFRSCHAEAFRPELDAATEVLVVLVAGKDAFLWLARIEHQACDAEDCRQLIQIAAHRIGEHDTARGIVDALAVEQAQVGADFEDLEGGVRRQQRVERGVQGLQCRQRLIEHGFEIEHFDDRRGWQLGEIDTGERAGCHG
ncbi:hypothetical protein D3C75_655400 [compost metagenome]